jgi:hypothetical protein
VKVQDATKITEELKIQVKGGSLEDAAAKLSLED